ncbi:TIM-barrel domain-containing protein [Desertivirga arenae]|uniref:TIM-barrel domain-containing protein n=1 Tax=Desertivirga arenae TaxID=2810309 RepID=UPI001A958F39|nr:TIM-barrel domain-containing protein [Pedobacter sp. SYSU D00823]
MFKQLLYSFSACLVFLSGNLYAQSKGFINANDGVTINPKNSSGNVRLQVISDKIVRVSVTPEKQFKKKQSLIIVDTLKRSGTWTATEQNGEVVLRTTAINAHVNLLNGKVRFTNKAGKLILSEKEDGRKFVPDSYDGDAFYKLNQTFISSDNEAFYGLGQHQEGIMNYKGRQVLLAQNNTEVAVPFLLSSNNYGVLWDNYSITKVGDTREIQQLSGLRLYSKDGERGWLTATYYNKKDSSQIFVRRAESKIDYPYLNDQNRFPANVKLDNSRIIWEGSMEPAVSGLHQFGLKYAGYIKIWIDGKLIADRWRQGWNPGTVTIDQNLTTGKRTKLKIEWIPDGAECYIALNYLSPAPSGVKNDFSFLSEAGDEIDYYFVYGNSADEVISGYRYLTGKASMMPSWAMGFWQSRERYKTQDEILETVKTFREKKIPLDNIVLDWSYWKEAEWGSQQFDETRFPDPQEMLKSLHQQYNTRLMISVWAKFYEGIDNYNYLNKNGWLYKRNIANQQRDWIGKGYVSTFYDAYNPGARTAFWSLINKNLYSKGIDAWWMDASEPDIHSNLDIESRKELSTPTFLGSSTRYFNGFALANAKGIYEGQRSVNPNSRVFILTRSAYAGLQRFGAATWSGDISARWHDMKDQIAAGLNFSMSGLPFWTMDIGGFAVEKRYEKPNAMDLEEWREQNARWYQFGAFTPLFRVHGQFPYREIYNIAPEDHPAYKSMLYYNKLRYKLMPYIYSLNGMAFHKDYTLMRGLAMDFPGDAQVRNINDQYMFGSSILVNPITEYGTTSRQVYLPQGSSWYNFYTGEYLKGGQSIKAAAAYEEIPLFVKEGAIIPTGPDIQYTNEKPADPISIYVYTGKDGTFNLYEDEGLNYNYEKGIFSEIPLIYNDTKGTLTIGDRKGSFPGMIKERTFNIVWITPQNGGSLTKNTISKTVKYDGKKLIVTK